VDGISGQHARLRQQTQELERLALVAELTDSAVIIADAEGRMTWANDAFTRISGYSHYAAQGKKPGALLQFEGTNPDTRAQLRAAIAQLQGMQDTQMVATLHELRSQGVSLALDDFGTGYSSLASLDQLPLDVVKIDRSFVQRMVGDRYQTALIEATLTVAASLGLDVVAEGVETEEQADLLRRAGCRYAQGWLYGKPMFAGELARSIASTCIAMEVQQARAMSQSAPFQIADVVGLGVNAMVPLPGEGWGGARSLAGVTSRQGLSGADRDWLPRRLVLHPFGVYRQPLHFEGERLARLPRT